MYRRRRFFTFLVISLAIALAGIFQELTKPREVTIHSRDSVELTKSTPASKALASLLIKGRAPKTGYNRAQFGNGWQQLGECNTRELILARDLKDTTIQNCKIQSGMLNDVYTGKTIQFIRGPETSDDIQIDHIVALSDAWQKGAQALTYEQREIFANDPLELIAVDGNANQSKGDGDAATWLPPNKAYRCQYVARQIAIKQKYSLWVTPAEHGAMTNILSTCPDQQLPIES